MKLYFLCLPKVQDYSEEMSALQRKASEGWPRAYVSYVFCVSYEGVRICEDQCQTKLQNLQPVAEKETKRAWKNGIRCSTRGQRTRTLEILTFFIIFHHFSLYNN